MANPEHLKILDQGIAVWNQWRVNNSEVMPVLRGADLSERDLSEADFSCTDLREADLYGVNFQESCLSEANLSGADLSFANLIGCDLELANLSEAYLGGAELNGMSLRGAIINDSNLRGSNFEKADLNGANLQRTDLSGTNLQEADLSDADLSDADLTQCNFKDANLFLANFERANLRSASFERAKLAKATLSHVNLESADLRRCDIIDTVLDGAVLTGAKLWESKRSGWSIRGVICEFAYFDREGEVKTEFEPGEFEKLYSEQTKIVLHYEDGLTQFEVTTLPALIQFIESKHPGSSLRLRTIGEDAGGASVTVAVDELGDADLSVLKEDFESYKERIREEVKRESEMEILFLQRDVKLLKDIIGENMGDKIYINQAGVVKAESSIVNQNINNNDLNDISKLISDILAARSEIEKVLPTEKAEEFNAALEVIEEQAKVPEKNWEKLKKGVQAVKKVLDGVGDAAGKWMPIAEKLSDLLQ